MEPDQKVDKVEAEFQPVRLLFAPVWKRMLSYLIDILLVGIVLDVILFAVYRKELAAILTQGNLDTQLKMVRIFLDSHNLQVSISSFVIQAAYFVLGWMSRGQTIGARIMKIVVITMDKKKLNLIQGLVRYSIQSLSSMAFYIPLIFVVNPVYHQRIHDALSLSVVVEVPEIEEGNGKKGPDEDEEDADRKDGL
jgi:uncharacterized RDD family membrane protein YckC